MPQARTSARSAVSRRAVLGGMGGLASAVALGGCDREETPPPLPLPDVGILTAAIAAEERLIALYEAVLRAHAGLSGRLDPMLAHHREHLAVLRRHHIPGTGTPTGGVPTVPAPSPSVPGEEDSALGLLRRAEGEAAVARADDVQRVAPGMAQLLASIGSCEAGHAVVLTEDER